MSHDEFETKFRALAAAGELLDMFAINGDMITSLGDVGALAGFAPDLAADAAWQETLLPGSLPEFVRGDKLYVIPSGMLVTHLIFYNADIFKDVGIDKFPDTWEGFKEAIVKLKAAGYTPIALGDKAMFSEGNWAAADVNRDAPEDVAKETQIAILPAVPGGKGFGTDTVTIAGWTWGINSNGR
jgi:raffinose/stachyose/melibiose transport system substrate-binding protein